MGGSSIGPVLLAWLAAVTGWRLTAVLQFFALPIGAGPPRKHGLSSENMARITPIRGAICSPNVKWPVSPRVVCPSACMAVFTARCGGRPTLLPDHPLAGGRYAAVPGEAVEAASVQP